MSRKVLACSVVLLLGCFASLQAEDKNKLTVKNMPPVVVKTVPESGDGKVDPSLTEIQVTFCKEMKDGVWSWSSAFENSEPKITGKPHYSEDKKTCVLPVQLEPGKTYGFWINSPKFGGFKDVDGKSAVPYLLIFETKK